MIRKLRESNSVEADYFFENDIADCIQETTDLFEKLVGIYKKIEDLGESGDLDWRDLEYLSKKFPRLVKDKLEDIQFILAHIENTSKEFRRHIGN